jgi:serine beta-lactamase-like protein LACTB
MRNLLPNRYRLFVVLLLIVASFGTYARAQDSTLPAEKRALINQAISHFMATTSVPGLSAAVVLDGHPEWSAGFGMADLENFVPATPATLFRLASISKPITATAVLQLWERGKLDLDAPIQKYCPAFPQKESPITTRQLLGHLGGIRWYNPDHHNDVPIDSARHFTSMEESLTVFENDPLAAKPGTKFVYSTYGYTVIGCVLEGASGQKYSDFVAENIFRPAGMNVTRTDDFFAVIPHRARGYHQEANGAVLNAGVLDSSYKVPGGGWLSSADDVASFAIAILADRLLKPATRELMWTPGKTASGEPIDYALGWHTQNKYGLALYSHTGGQQGTSTSILLAPERKAGIVVLTNLEGADVASLSDQILRIVLDLPAPHPIKGIPPKPPRNLCLAVLSSPPLAARPQDNHPLINYLRFPLPYFPNRGTFLLRLLLLYRLWNS